MLSKNEYIKRRFETTHPDLVKLIDEWVEFSISQGKPEAEILLNALTVPNCPPDEYDEKIGWNLRYKFFKELSEEVMDYIVAYGYPAASTKYPVTVKCPGGYYSGGHVVTALNRDPLPNLEKKKS